MHAIPNALNVRAIETSAHTQRAHEDFLLEGRELKTFTSLEIDAAVRSAYRAALINVNDTMAGLIWRTCAAKVTADVMCNLGLGKPEEFYR